MSVLQEILTWSKDLPDWQSDAIARLFKKPSLSPEDIEDIFALLKADHGIPDPKERKAVRFSSDQVPTVVQANTHVELLAIKKLKNVNALANNERLPLEPKGLNIIYGDNASGKSGYSRVLKCACRARDQSELVLPNANMPAGQVGKAEATFEITIDGVSKEEQWVAGEAPPAV